MTKTIHSEVTELINTAVKLGTSKKKICEDNGFDRSTMTNWLSGKTKPSVDYYLALKSYVSNLIEIHNK